MALIPRYYQNDAVNSIFDYFAVNDGNPVLALPTGTGKAFVIALFIMRVLQMWPRQRFMILTHVKELVTQDADELRLLWPNAPIGIYSAGLNQKDIAQPIIFGGVASVCNVVEAFGHRDLIIVDECHLLSPKDDSMYQNTIARLKVINPQLKVIGLSATPYRLGQGMITDEGLFTDICYDITHLEAFNRLVYEGYISPLVPKRTKVEIDVSSVGINNGDYKKGELQDVSDKITFAACEEMVEFGHNRKSWLVFASGVDHCEHVAEILQSMGISCASIHSKLKPDERDRRIKAHKNFEIQALINNNVLTTGYNHKPIDFIGMLRATLSPGLWVQMLGRGTRPSPETGKENCLVLDFAGNTRRLGPINDPVKPRKPGKGGGDAPVRICDCCGVYNHASARYCGGGSNPEDARSMGGCGYEFTFESKIVSFASTEDLIKSDAPVVEYFNVDRVIYHRHEKLGSKPTIKVSYHCGLRAFNEFVCLEHGGFAGKHARDWWRQRFETDLICDCSKWDLENGLCGLYKATPPSKVTVAPFANCPGYESDASKKEPPEHTDTALRLISGLRVPKRIRVWANKIPYPGVLSYEY